MNVSELIAGYIKACGIDRVYGYPGDPNVELLENFRREELSFVLARREGTAALMAEAYGMLTGKPGVCVSTLGPGSSNLVNGVANAFMDRVPMIAISGQIAARMEKTFTHQVLDHTQLFGSIVKYLAAMRTDNAGAVMRRAIRTAMAPRPGPVHLTTHADVVGAELTGDTAIRLPPMDSVGGAAATIAVDRQAGRVQSLIDAAARPVILAGIGAVQAAAHADLIRFAETIGAAVVTAPMAKGVFPEDHPLFAGVIDMACNDFIWDFLKTSDLIITAGFDPVELIKPWTVDAPAIWIDSVPNCDQIIAADTELIGDMGAILAGLSDIVRAEPRFAESELKGHRETLWVRMTAGRNESALNPTDVVNVCRAAMPRGTIATSDVGSHKLLVGQGWQTHAPREMLMSNGLSSMGFSLPAGIVARDIMPDRPVLTFIGDGGLAMVQGELRLASALGAGLTVVVFNDRSLNRIELKQMARQYQSTGTRIESTDVEKLAASMDCDGIKVSTETALADALAQQKPDRPLVIGAEISPDQYEAQF